MVKVYDMVTCAVSEPDREVSLVLGKASDNAEQSPPGPALGLQEIELTRATHTELPASVQGIHPDTFLANQDKR